MSKTRSAKIQDHFAELTDPRRRKVTYPLMNIVAIAVCAVIAGADDFVAIAKFGRTKRPWFARFLEQKEQGDILLFGLRQGRPSGRAGIFVLAATRLPFGFFLNASVFHRASTGERTARPSS